jgi:hypothetical protein
MRILSIERREVIRMGWWQTDSGGIIGDGPADLIDEAGGRWADPAQIPPRVRAEIAACYRKDWDREPTQQELRDLLAFCGLAAGRG